jgi:PP-loop superfamily ATP-utilizing enzyme
MTKMENLIEWFRDKNSVLVALSGGKPCPKKN